MHTSASAIADPRRPHAGKLSQASLLHQSDDRLVSLARSGSERAWAEITRRYGRQLRVYCTRFVGASRSEDVVQQTFLQAFLSLRDGSHRDIVLRAWLYRIAHNCSIDLLRKGSTDYDELDLEYDGVAQPPTLFEQREEIRRLVARMRALPDAQRQALALRELEGRSYEEISAQLGHSGSGVRQLIFRARTALRNGAAAVLPLGFLRTRLSGPLPVECHHLATAVSVPASSGSGADVVGAATLAVVAVLGGGFAAADSGSRKARPAPARHSAPAPRVAAPVVGVGVGAGADARTASSPARGVGGHARRPEAPQAITAPPAASPLVAAAVPPAPPAPPPAAEAAPPTAPSVSDAAPADVQQQTLVAPGTAPTTSQAPVVTSAPAPPAPPANGNSTTVPQPGTAAGAPPAPKPVKAPVAKPPVKAPKTPKTPQTQTAPQPQKGVPAQKPLPALKPAPRMPAPKSPPRTGARR